MSGTVNSTLRRVWPELITALLVACVCIACSLQTPSPIIVVMGTIGVAVLVVFAFCRALMAPGRPHHLSHGTTSIPLGLFALALVAVCTLSALLFPPIGVPDEHGHYRSAYIYSDLLTGQSADTIRVCDDQFLRSFTENGTFSVDKWELVHDYLHTPYDTSTMTDAPLLVETDYWGNDPQPNTVCNILEISPVQLKIGGALGLIIGRALGLNPTVLFYLGRLTTMALVVALICLAIYLTPLGKTAFMVVSLLPISIHLIGSYSSDGMILALCMLLLTLYLRAICQSGPLGHGAAIGILVLSFLLAPCKMIYMCMALMVLLIPHKRFSSTRAEVAFKLSVFLVSGLGIVVFKSNRFMSLASPSQSHSLDHRGGEYGHFYTLSWALSHPLEVLQLYASAFASPEDGAMTWARGMVGGDLGWQTAGIAASPAFVTLLYVVLFVSSLRTTDDSHTPTRPMRILFVALFLLTLFLALMGMLLTWTFDTEDAIHGVQGRYLLPMLPALLVAVSPKKVFPSEVVSRTVCLMCSLDFAYLMWICMRVMLSTAL